jgi:hypothetical protein
MASDNVTTTVLVLFSTVTGALIGMVPTMVLAGQAERRERARELWRRDADRCAELEEIAGEITDRLSGWGVRPEDWEPIGKKIGDMARPGWQVSSASTHSTGHSRSPQLGKPHVGRSEPL